METFQKPLDIFRTIVERIDRREAFAIAVVLDTRGSTPRETGARALIGPNGNITGTIGGGAMEGEARRRGVEAIASGRAVVFECRFEGIGLKEAIPICGGTMRVLLDPSPGAHCEIYARARDVAQAGQSGILITTVTTESPDTPSKVDQRWIDMEAVAQETFPPGAEVLQRVLEEETPFHLLKSGEAGTPTVEILAEPVLSRPVLLIAGGGHVGCALAWQAAMIGYDVTVVDDRPEYTDASRYPDGVKTVCGDIPGFLAAFPCGPETSIVLVTRGHLCDAAALEVCIRKPTGYLGMIGSRRKTALMRREFLQSGRATEEEWSRIHAPIGLDIGALSVPEIAVSIAAQLIAVRRTGHSAGMPTQEIQND
jgi:xanthine dehydrogenase accessory factor